MLTVRKFVCGAACFVAAGVFAAGMLPIGYTEIEYIQGTNATARIVTDYVPTPNADKIEAVIEFPAGTLGSSDHTIWCARETDVKGTWTLFVFNRNGASKFRFDYGTTKSADLTPALGTGTKYTVTAEGNVFTCSGGQGVTMSKVADFTAGGPVTLFASYVTNTDTSKDKYGKQRLYSFKVWRSGELIHYFVPCKDPSGDVTMVDICDNPATLSKNGKFAAGPEGHYFDDALFGSLSILPISDQYLDVGASECTPEPVVRTSDGVTLLKKGVDYTVSYTGNTQSGNAYLTVMGINDYAGKGGVKGFKIYRRYFVDDDAASGGDGSKAEPFATISNAIEQADAAIAGGASLVTIHIEDGDYPENGLVVTNAIIIEGNAADRTAVKIGKTGARVFRIAHADAALKNLTVQNGTVTTSAAANAGGNVRLENGTVANCVLTGGSTTVQDAKGLNLYISTGLAVDCLLTCPSVGSGTYGPGAYIAGGVVSCCTIEKASKNSGSWLAIGAGAYMTGGVIENCLLRDNSAGKGAIYLDGATAKAVNCTIVGNIPESGSNGGIGGVTVNNASASVINCVIFDNGGTATAEWGNKNGARFFNCVSPVDNANGVNWIKLPSAARWYYFEDDEFWTPLVGSPMVDGGSDSLYPSTTSQTDIVGNPRISGSHIDIGCSELDQSSFKFRVTVEGRPSVVKGKPVDFISHAVGAADTVTFEFDFGDGSAHLETMEASASHSFNAVGLFHVRVRAKVGSGEYGDWTALDTPILVSEADIYVSTEGSDANLGTAAAPFLTVARALASLTNVTSACATDVDGVTVHIADGTYEENALPVIASRVTVEGNASDRTAVKIGKSGTRIFRLVDAGAVLKNLTVQNGTVTNADVAYAGGNVRLEAGMVTNCVLTGASDTIQDGKGLNLYIGGGIVANSLLTSPSVFSGTYGAGAYIAGGVVSRCIIEKAAKNSSTWPAIGSGAYMKGGVLENCLLCGNSCEKGAIYLDAASAKAVNCSVIGNVVVNNKVGGIYVNNASATVVNCVVYGNGGTANNEWANKNAARFYSCAFAESAAFTGANSTVTNLTDAAFKDFANGDYRPKREGALVNSGTNDLYSSYATSATDLGGAPRIQGKIIDIGCWEMQAGLGFQIIVR